MIDPSSAAGEDDPALVIDEPGSMTVAWHAPDGAQPPAFAARELCAYVRRMTGTAPAVVEAPAVEFPDAVASGIVLSGPADGESSSDALRAAARALPDDPPRDAFSIRVTAGDEIGLAGATHRATLYAAYALLETLGVRFFAPAYPFYEGAAERVPDRDVLRFHGVETVESPSFAVRRKYVEEGWSHTPLTLAALVDWMAKTRHNVLVCPTDYRGFGVTEWDAFRDELVPELEKRGLLLETGGHGFDSFVDPEATNGDNPEWFVGDANVFDLTDERAVRAYLERVCEYLRERPEIDIFDAWPPDDPVWPPRVIEEFGSISNAYAYLVNRLDERIRTEFPDREIRLEAIAYLNHVEPPDDRYMFGESVIVDFAPVDRSYEAPLFDEGIRANDRYGALLERWTDRFDGDIGIYEYYRKYSWHSLPVVLRELVGREIPQYRTAGAAGFGTYSEPADWLPYEFTHLVVAAMTWNADLDAESYFEQYLAARYGEGADAIGTYFERIESAGRTLFTRFGGSYADVGAVGGALRDYERARDALDRAIPECDDGTNAEVVLPKLLQNVQFAVSDTRAAYYGLTGREADRKVATQECLELIEAGRFNGTVLQSYWTLDRCLPVEIPNDTGWIRRLYREEW